MPFHDSKIPCSLQTLPSKMHESGGYVLFHCFTNGFLYHVLASNPQKSTQEFGKGCIIIITFFMVFLKYSWVSYMETGKSSLVAINKNDRS